jgi:hypothetical protein
MVPAVHIISSVGWLGAIAAFLVLSIAGVTFPTVQLVRAAYLGMHEPGRLDGYLSAPHMNERAH